VQAGGSDLSGQDNAGASLVHAAAQGGSRQIFDRLLALGADGAARTRTGRTCLHYAAQSARQIWLLHLFQSMMHINQSTPRRRGAACTVWASAAPPA
jgi:ankyrin repeat protein